MQVLGPDADRDRLALFRGSPTPHHDPAARERLPLPARRRPGMEVHRRRADESATKSVAGLLRRPPWARRSAPRPAFITIMRSPASSPRPGRASRRGSWCEPPVQLLDLEAHLHAQLGVEVGQRLVEQEHRRLAHDRASHRHARCLCRRAGGACVASSGPGRDPAARSTRLDLVAWRSRGCSRTHVVGRRSCADRARSSGTPSRCRGPWARRVDHAVADHDLPPR